MSDAANRGPASNPPKKAISPVRHVIGLVVLIALVAIAWLEYSATSQFNAAVPALQARIEDEEKEMPSESEVQTILGKEPDGPAVDEGQFRKKTYTWKGLFRSHTLTAYYNKDADPKLHHYQTAGAEAAVTQPGGAPAAGPGVAELPPDVIQTQVDPAPAPGELKSEAQAAPAPDTPAKAEEPKAEEPKAEEPKAEEPKAP